MDIGYAVLKGIVQGLAEFLPISSTAHLVFANTLTKMMGLQSVITSPEEEEFFNILLHLGTVGAIGWYFKTEIVQSIQYLTGKKANNNSSDSEEKISLSALPQFLVISVFCTAVLTLGVLKGSEFFFAQNNHFQAQGIEDLSEFYFANPMFVALHLIFTGFLLFFSQKMAEKRGNTGSEFNTRHAVSVGIFQGVAAIFHGVSRSGSTISAGMATGLDRLTATRYSFMLGFPTFILATVYELIKYGGSSHMDAFNWPLMALGTVIAGIVGYYCIKIFIRFVASNPLTIFAYYCWGIGILMFFTLNAT